MTEYGYALSSEEHDPLALVELAARAERAGFSFALISDHFHPWTNRQGQSPFVWSVIGAIARATSSLRLGTGVTCPSFRIHPAIIAQAAATSAAMMPGRFFLGVGSGENLNEHILGQRWPEIDVRLEMLEEAIAVMRLLWEGGSRSHHGRYFTVENARIYTLPDEPPLIAVAAGGKKSAALAGRAGDALIGTAPKEELLERFASGGGEGKPRIGQIAVCYAADEQTARRTALEWWPNGALRGELGQELTMPAHFQQAVSSIDEDDIAEAIVCGPDPEKHAEKIREFQRAGYDQIYFHQVGPDQEPFFRFYETQVLPKV